MKLFFVIYDNFTRSLRLRNVHNLDILLSNDRTSDYG